MDGRARHSGAAGDRRRDCRRLTRDDPCNRARENAKAAGEVPAAIKAKGTLNVATEAPYAPNEFIAPDGHTVIGMDADLVNALGRGDGAEGRT